MTEPIMPKETTYRGIWFKSRLEARWAVFIDNLPHYSDRWGYEITTLNVGHGAYTYTPDFTLFRGDSILLHLEVKPIPPNKDYIHNLSIFAKYLENRDIPFLLGIGSFYRKKVPYIRQFKDGKFGKPDTLLHYFAPAGRASDMARAYRFDL